MRSLRAVPLIAAILLTGGCAATVEPAATSPLGAVTLDRTLHQSLPEDVRSRGSIRLLTDASYPPMEQFAADGITMEGFEPDLANALGAVLGIRIEMVQGVFHSAVESVQRGDYDGVLSSMTDTPERARKVDFVDYFTAGTSILVRRGNPRNVTGLDDLCGQIVSTERGTIQADMLTRRQPGCGTDPMTIKLFKTNADALVELRTGRVTAVLNDYPTAAYLATESRTRSFYQLASTEQYEPGLFGIAVSQKDTALRDGLRAALDQLIASGTYTELLQRWGVTSGAVPKATINGGR
jgi:polar amino acid transport system substrate-binding protein